MELMAMTGTLKMAAKASKTAKTSKKAKTPKKTKKPKKAKAKSNNSTTVCLPWSPRVTPTT